MENELELTHCDISSAAYRNVENLVADITDRALLNGHMQRKQAFTASQLETYRLKDHFNYSFSNAPNHNFEIGYSFKQLGIGSHENADRILNVDQTIQSKMADEAIITPNMSSCGESDENQELDEIAINEQLKNNPFYGMQRISQESSFSKLPMNKQQTDAEHENQDTTILQQRSFTKNYLNIFYFIIKFKYLLKKFISIRNIFTLKSHQFELINDKSFGNQMIKKKKNASIQYKILQFFKLLWGKYTQIPVLDPSHLIVVGQEILSFAFILSQFFFLPIKTSFTTTLINEYLILALETLPPYYFFSEMIFTINKGYYHEGIAIVDRISVFFYYIKNSFIVDLITTGVLYVDSQNSFYALIFLFRIPQLQQIFEKIDEHFQFSQKFPIAFQLFQLLYQIILVAHICGCGFHYVGLHSDSDNNWIIKNKLNQQSILERYVCSVYFAIIAMITVGFGDVVPVNTYERIYVILQTCFSCGIFAFAINTIGNIVKEKQEKAHVLKVNKNLVLSYMRDRNISNQNQNKVIFFFKFFVLFTFTFKVIRFLEYSHKNQNDIPQKGKEIIQGMGKSVRDAVYQEFFNRVINQMPLFQNNFTENFKLEIQSHLNETVYGPGDCIITQGKTSKNVYFIVTGEVQQVIKMKESSQQQQVPLQVLKQGDSFDEECFVSNLPCKYEYISKTVTQVVFIQKDVFEEVIQAYKHDYELYCMLIHTIRLEGIYAFQSKGCQSCQNKSHDAINCPFLHYEVNYELFLKRFICDKPQKREQYTRKRSRTNRGKYKIIHDQLKLFRLRLPKTYQPHIQLTHEIFALEQIDLKKLLEFDDEMFIMCAPKISYSKTEEDIVFIHDEEDIDCLQEMFEEIENTEEYSVNELTTLRSREENKLPERRNALYTLKMQNEDINQQQIQEQLEESNQDDKDDEKQDFKILNFAFSSDFSTYTPKLQGQGIEKKLKNIRSLIPRENLTMVQNHQQHKSKSLTNLKEDIQITQMDQEEKESTDEEKGEDTLREFNNQKLIDQQKQQFLNHHDSQQNPVVQCLPKKLIYSEQEEEYYQGQKGSQISNNNCGIQNSSLTGQNIEESCQTLPNNQIVMAKLQTLNDDQPNSGKLSQGKSYSDRVISLQSIQSPSNLSPKRLKDDQNSKDFNKLQEILFLKQQVQQKIKSYQSSHQNQQQLQNFQQNNQLQNISQTIQNLKTIAPTLHIQNVQTQSKNTLIHSSSAQNIQFGNNSPLMAINPKQSRISIHLNEPTPVQNQTLSINNISHSQIRELSSYSRRTVNSTKSSNKIGGSQIQTPNLQQQNKILLSQLSQPQINSGGNILQHQSTSNQNAITRQNSNYSVSNPNRQKKHQTFITNKVKTNSSTIVKSQNDVLQQQQQQQQQNALKQQNSMEELIELTQQEKQLMILDFETMKIFQYFLPHNNYDLVLEQYKIKFQSKKTIQKKSGKIGRKPKRIGTVYQKQFLNRRKQSQTRSRRKQEFDSCSPSSNNARSSFIQQVDNVIMNNFLNEKTNQSS